jgi:hypothetical protein
MQEISTGDVATGAAVLTAETAIASAPYVAPLVEGTTAMRVGSASADFASQVQQIESIDEYNITSTLAAAAMPNSNFVQSGLGNFGQIKVGDIRSGNFFQSTVFGDETFMNAASNTLVEGSFSYLGSKGETFMSSNGLGGSASGEAFSSFSSNYLANQGAKISNLLTKSYNQTFRSDTLQ